MKKFSYRELAKRRFAGKVLWYLHHTEPDFDFSKTSKAEQQIIKSAYGEAKQLLATYKKGIEVNLTAFTPYQNEIRRMLEKQLPAPQLQLHEN